MLFGCEQKPESQSSSPGGNTITGMHFTYDMFSGEQFYLDVHIESMNEKGAEAELTKRVGPVSSHQSKKGNISIDGSQVAELLEILNSYDLAGWSHLPKWSASSAPSRSLIVFSGEDILYDIFWNAKFPETFPPQEDIMYAELYNFFNDLISNEPGWEEVISSDLDDPRNNPAYAERIVSWFGNDVKLVIGTGVYYEDGTGAEIDYEGKNWWMEEGFTGTWILDEEKNADALNPITEAEFKVSDDGTVSLKINDETWNGVLSEIRRYRNSAGMTLERDNEKRYCDIDTVIEESYEMIHITCYPGPVPEEQFDPIDVYLKRSVETGGNE